MTHKLLKTHIMSLSNSSSVQNRLKLKARRFKNHGQHSQNIVLNKEFSENINSSRYGTKRLCSDDDRTNQKRFRLSESSANPIKPKTFRSTSCKNLANNRLKNLRENLKSSINNAATNKNEKISGGKTTDENNIKRSVGSTTLTNSANNRLKRLRGSIEETNETNCHNSSKKTISNSSNNNTGLSKIGNTESPLEKQSRLTLDSELLQNDKANVRTLNKVNSLVENEVEVNGDLNQTSKIVLEYREPILRNVDNSATNLLDSNQDEEKMDWKVEEVEVPLASLKKTTGNKPKLKNLCIVVDTNILMSNLNVVKDILLKKFDSAHQPIVFIPWMVMTELDYIKDKSSNEKLKNLTSTAIRFINIELEMENPRLKGQSVVEASKQESIGSSPDDKIIACCLQVMQIYEEIILLSNDINLKNKAMINGISTCSANEALIKIITKLRNNIKSQRILNKMGILCSQVITICAQEEFGEIAAKMELLKNGPWSLKDCLKRFQRYWATVFREKINKQFTKSIDVLLNLLAKWQYIRDDSEDYNILMKHCITMCIFLKDISECREMVQRTLDELIKINDG